LHLGADLAPVGTPRDRVSPSAMRYDSDQVVQDPHPDPSHGAPGLDPVFRELPLPEPVSESVCAASTNAQRRLNTAGGCWTRRSDHQETMGAPTRRDTDWLSTLNETL